MCREWVGFLSVGLISLLWFLSSCPWEKEVLGVNALPRVIQVVCAELRFEPMTNSKACFFFFFFILLECDPKIGWWSSEESLVMGVSGLWNSGSWNRDYCWSIWLWEWVCGGWAITKCLKRFFIIFIFISNIITLCREWQLSKHFFFKTEQCQINF